MAIRIIKRPHDFLLVGERRQFSLSVSCAEGLCRYNEATARLPETDAHLYAAFADARGKKATVKAINELLQAYRLKRRPAFAAEQFAPILIPQLKRIRQRPGDANPDEITSVDRIITSFNELRQRFTDGLPRRKDLLPEVTLSKLLHFIRPECYWIVDSRIKAVLFIWGYSESFAGFGEFLKDLFRDENFRQLKSFLRVQERTLIAGRPALGGDTPLLKLIDKMLWSRAD